MRPPRRPVPPIDRSKLGQRVAAVAPALARIRSGLMLAGRRRQVADLDPVVRELVRLAALTFPAAAPGAAAIDRGGILAPSFAPPAPGPHPDRRPFASAEWASLDADADLVARHLAYLGVLLDQPWRDLAVAFDFAWAGVVAAHVRFDELDNRVGDPDELDNGPAPRPRREPSPATLAIAPGNGPPRSPALLNLLTG